MAKFFIIGRLNTLFNSANGSPRFGCVTPVIIQSRPCATPNGLKTQSSLSVSTGEEYFFIVETRLSVI